MNRLLQDSTLFQGRPSDTRIGEITGISRDDFTKEYEQGMPSRALNYNIKKKAIQEDSFPNNNHSDKPLINLEYFDQANNNMFTDIAELEQTTKLNGITNIFNDYTWYLYTGFLSSYPKKDFLISPYFVMNFFSFIYIGAKNKTAIEIKNHFNLPDKTNIFESIEANNKIINQTIDNLNLLLLNTKVSPNRRFMENNKTIMNLVSYDKNNITNDLNKINYILKSRIIKPEYLINNNLMYIINLNYKPEFDLDFNNSLVSNFFNDDNEERKQEYIVSRQKKKCDYYTDQDVEILELKMKDNQVSMGIIISKGNRKLQISNDQITRYIDKLMDMTFDYVIIPKYTKTYKFRYNGILKEAGLSEIFKSTDCPDFITERVPVDDIIQQITISITNNNNNRISENSINSRDRIFLANCPYIYYFRLLQTNTIVLVGQYS